MRIATLAIASALLAVVLLAPFSVRVQASSPAPVAAKAPGLLTREQAAAILPATVFYNGQTAAIQARNSAGLRLPSGKLVLIAVVDTSGYSSAVQQSYQAYLLTEAPLRIAGQTLPPGAYGTGFVTGENKGVLNAEQVPHFLVLDLGGNQILSAPSQRDAALPRPNPLQLLPDPSNLGTFRLYSGRSFVAFTPADASR